MKNAKSYKCKTCIENALHFILMDQHVINIHNNLAYHTKCIMKLFKNTHYIFFLYKYEINCQLRLMNVLMMLADDQCRQNR